MCELQGIKLLTVETNPDLCLQMLWFHAASWFFILPYLLIHVWILLMDVLFAKDHRDGISSRNVGLRETPEATEETHGNFE